jgi:hypothetical protein
VNFDVFLFSFRDGRNAPADVVAARAVLERYTYRHEAEVGRSQGSGVRSQKMAVVTRAHQGGQGDPIRFGAGEILRWERRATEWEGWLWCTDAKGVMGWVPETYVARIDAVTCRTLCDYDATELTVAPGDVLDVKFAESGWVWCETADGRKGWVPESHVANEG